MADIAAPVAFFTASTTPTLEERSGLDNSADEPSAGMMPVPDRLGRPELPTNPSQADLGGQVYYMVCMACHGDQGQGLTPEWVEAWDLGEENSCWQSKCHAANHPEEGFELPKWIPPVIGPVIRARFGTAQDLYDFLREKMPWQAPGSLSDTEYWQVTAYLMKLNGINPGEQILGPENAMNLRLQPGEVKTPGPSVAGLGKNVWQAGIAVLGLILLFLLVKFVLISCLQ